MRESRSLGSVGAKAEWLSYPTATAAGSAGSEYMLHVEVERRWELRDRSGKIVDSAQSNSERDVYRLHRLLGQAVAGTAVDAPRSFSLRFASGEEL